MRLLYSGPSESANVKRFEDDAIAAALTHGWRLTRAQPDGPPERDEPTPDARGAEPPAPAEPATDDPAAADPPTETDPKPRRLKR